LGSVACLLTDRLARVWFAMHYFDLPELIASIEAQGSLLSMKVRGYKSAPNKHGSKRGIIRVFSQAARRRMMRFLARLKTRKIRATFITLTFTEVVSNERAKLVFKRFSMRLRRRFEEMSAVWRMEFQERGAIHFHILAFKMPFWKQKELQETWEACTEERRSIAHIKLVHGAKMIMAYISKYIAKKDERSEITSLEDGSYQHEGRDKLSGRFWGYINKELLPLGEVIAGVLTDRDTIKSISSLVWSILGDGNPYKSLSFHLFCDNARWLCERAIEEGGCFLDEWEYTTKDHTTQSKAPDIYWHDIPPEPHSGGSVDAALDHARPSVASSSQPCIRQWLQPSCLREVQARSFPYFDEYGTIVRSDQYKQE